eukprot:4397479-Karenia_brevis.AAC.1
MFLFNMLMGSLPKHQAQTFLQKAKDEDDADVDTMKISEQVECSLNLGSALWSFNTTDWSTAAVNTEGQRSLPK